MKLKNFLLAIKVLKYIQKNPNCTIPQIRDFYGVEGTNPPSREEKDLYKVITYLNNYDFIDKINNKSISPRGAHYYLKITRKGIKTLLTIKEIFSDIMFDVIPQDRKLNEGEHIASEGLSTDFSMFSYEILKTLELGLLDQLPIDARRLLTSRKARINILIENCHNKLQEKVSKIIDSLL